MKHHLGILAIAAVTFVICGSIMLLAHEKVNHPIAIYSFMAVWGASAIITPVYLVKVASGMITSFFRSKR